MSNKTELRSTAAIKLDVKISEMKPWEQSRTGDGHTHPNLPLLNNLSIENNYLKVGSTPVETHLLSEEW